MERHEAHITIKTQIIRLIILICNKNHHDGTLISIHLSDIRKQSKYYTFDRLFYIFIADIILESTKKKSHMSHMLDQRYYWANEESTSPTLFKPCTEKTNFKHMIPTKSQISLQIFTV